MWPAIGVAAVLLAVDRVLKALSRKGKLHYEGKAVRLTNLENPGFFLGKGSRHRAFLRWGRWRSGSRRRSCCCLKWRSVCVRRVWVSCWCWPAD